MKIFLTGASGCIGHYVVETLLVEHPNLELHLLYRDEKRFKFSYPHPRIFVHKGDMNNIEIHKSVLSQMAGLIHIATEWGDYEHTVHINVTKTEEMLSYLDPKILKRVVYFSTASILGPNNQPVEAAEKYGTPYVRSKYLALREIEKLPIADKIVTLFPTTVWGGNATFPKSHLTSGLPDNTRWVKILKWFYFEARFHFLHAKDIASVVSSTLFLEKPKSRYVLGMPVITEKKAVQTFAKILNQKIWVQLKIPFWFIFFLLKVFRIKLAPWDRYCITHPDFSYQVVNPTDFGKTAVFPSLESVVLDALKK